MMKTFVFLILCVSIQAQTPRPSPTNGGPGSGGSGTVTSITCNGGLTGGTITTSGACAADKTLLAQKFFGTAPPGSVAGNLPGDLFSDTTNHNDYWCAAVSGTAAPACTSVTAGGWTLNGGGSVFTGSTCPAPNFSATPTFSFADISVKSPTCFEPTVMTANVTAVSLSNPSAGARTSIKWLQAASGTKFSVTYGGTITNTCQVSQNYGYWTEQFIKIGADGVTPIGDGCSTNDPADTPALICNTTITTGTTATLSDCFTVNQEATAGTGVTYTLPTAAAGLQFCIDSGWNGSAVNTGVLTFSTSASGQFMVFTDGTLTATGGNVTSGGAARDGACVYGIDSTHWMFLPHSGTWTKH